MTISLIRVSTLFFENDIQRSGRFLNSRINSLFAGVKVYRKFYTEEREKSYGVLAISVSKPSAQPYTTMTDILVVSATL
jgi:hypothetical protein